MTDWQVGDLALCVSVPDCATVAWLPTVGCVYTVADVFDAFDDFGQPFGIGIELEEDPDAFNYAVGGWDPDHFRKVLPDKHEACEAEFLTLLKRSKRKVTA